MDKVLRKVYLDAISDLMMDFFDKNSIFGLFK